MYHGFPSRWRSYRLVGIVCHVLVGMTELPASWHCLPQQKHWDYYRGERWELANQLNKDNLIKSNQVICRQEQKGTMLCCWRHGIPQNSTLHSLSFAYISWLSGIYDLILECVPPNPAKPSYDSGLFALRSGSKPGRSWLRRSATKVQPWRDYLLPRSTAARCSSSNGLSASTY
jgi:hypothetical protein